MTMSYGVLTLISLACIATQVVLALKHPAISYYFSNESARPFMGTASPHVQFQGSKFQFGNVFKNLINVDDPKTVPENTQVLVLRCTSPNPIRWTAAKPLGSIRLVVGHNHRGLNQSIHETGVLSFVLQLFVQLKSNFFSTKLRCEELANSEIVSEIYLNRPSSFLKSLQSQETRSGILSFFNSGVNSGDPNVNITVPCVAKALPGYLRLMQPNISESAFDYIQLVITNQVTDLVREFKAKFGHLGSYDPRVGFLVAPVTGERNLDSSFSCKSTISSHSEIMIPVSSEQRILVELHYHNGTKDVPGVYCTSPNDSSIKLYIKYGICNSILDCDLKWKPQEPHVFSATNSSVVYQIVRTEPFEHIFQPQRNGVKLEQNRGFLHCAGAFEQPGMVGMGRSKSLKFVSVMDYIFIGLDGMTYLISKEVPSSAIIRMTKVESSDDEEASRFYTLECRISTFVLLPHIKLVLESRLSEQPSLSKKASASWSPTERDREIGRKQPVASTLAPGVAVGISVAVIVVVALIILQVFVWRKYKSAVAENRNLTKAEVDEFHFGNATLGQEQDDVPLESRPFVKNKIIKSQDLKTEDTVLGKGEFGIVHKGNLRGLEVAVKSSKLGADVEYFKAFLKEIKVMAYMGEHDNIVIFHGAVVDRIEENLCSAVIELSPFGNLNCYLQDNSKKYSDEIVNPSASNLTYVNEPQIMLNHSVLISFCQQIAAGMEYLTSKAVIHGDLATRNVLVFHRNVVKITDFGLSRKLYNCANYTKTNKAPVPWRWMAIESLRYFKFSTKSDVWSFGVTMWEIFSLGRVPFAGVNWTTEFVDQLESGFRLMKPRLCTMGMFDWMMKCWSNEAADRPTFTECTGILSNPHDYVISLTMCVEWSLKLLCSIDGLDSVACESVFPVRFTHKCIEKDYTNIIGALIPNSGHIHKKQAKKDFKNVGLIESAFSFNL